MNIKKSYSVLQMAWWTRFETLFFLAYITAWVLAYYFLEIHWVQIPWTPLALIGTAVAFVIGFQNNAAYDRLWEARKIWGGIVNTSRTLGIYTQDMIDDQEDIKTITYRHIGWMTALRHSMRQSKPWETSVNHRTNTEWNVKPPEFKSSLEEDLRPYISDKDFEYVMSKSNKQTALLYLQSHHLKTLKEKGTLWEFSFLQMEGVIEELFTLQGKSERIKNFPYPRQFATLNSLFMWAFVLILPIAMVPQFQEIGTKLSMDYRIAGTLFIWASIPIYVIVSWIFHTMERIGRTGDNPFEGIANDVPISTIARGIEIDLRENLGEEKSEIPAQFEIDHNIQF